ncbi:MAG TPA: DNA polymerase III subunit delta [Verrucomicrobiae bacterium]|nr:DNA polymerase III subunit delta [Verrucomicrobiae bacterium]
MPPINSEKLIERLAGGTPVPGVLLLGSDPYLRDLCRAKIIEACVPEPARSWAVARIATEDSSGWNDLLERVQTMPMLSPRQVVVAEGAEAFEEMPEKTREALLEALEKYLRDPAPFTLLLIEAAQLDRRQRFFKLLAERALLVELTLGEESASALAAQMARDLGAEMEPAAASFLAEICDSEPARIRLEVDKLAAYSRGRGSITPADVRALVVSARKNDVWQLADMLSARRRTEALSFLDNLLREGDEPIVIVGALAWAYRKLIEARELPATTNPYNAARSLGMNPNSAGAALRNAHRFSKKELLSGLVDLAEADSALKSSNPNPRAYMEFLVARLTSRTV